MTRRILLAALACSLALASPRPAASTPLPRKFLDPVVVVETSLGTVRIRLYPQKAPRSVANFLRYMDDHFYDDTLVHRVIPHFMVQAGGYDRQFNEKPGRDPIANESANGVSNTRGTIACARTQDPNSARAQFFINVKDNVFLDRANSRDRAGYCVFGEVVAGMDVVDKIVQVPTGARGGHQNVPAQDVVIKSIRRAAE
jgi:cyclophilin family peptidyl-prolyl cis-trans isomerase